MTRAAVIGIPLGDPNGIGPEIAVKAARAGRSSAYRTVLFGDAHVIARYADGERVRIVNAGDLPPPDPGAIELHAIDALPEQAFRPGDCGPHSGRATVAYAQAAIGAARSGKIDAVVACPHNETAINAAGIPFSGYPPFVARAVGLAEDRVFLMLDGGGFRIVHATLHEGVATALSRLDRRLVLAACEAAHEALRHFGVARPRIGLFGINPHAGEGGLFGQEDERTTFPAAAEARAAGLDIVGPLGGDLLLSQRECDVYVAMLHDQGHIPIKLLADRQSIAFSVGAGITFASVGHGSAADIAGRNIADASPLIAALDRVAEVVAVPNEDLAA